MSVTDSTCSQKGHDSTTHVNKAFEAGEDNERTNDDCVRNISENQSTSMEDSAAYPIEMSPTDTFQQRFRKDKGFRRKVLHTMCVALGAIAAGWRITIIGVTLPDAMLLINEDLSTSSWILTSWSLGHLIGSLAVGILYDRCNKLLVLLGTYLGIALTCALTPVCTTLLSMLIVQFVGGIFAIAGHSVCTTDTLFLWKQDSQRFLLLVHFAISIGGSICPLVSDPFLAKRLTDQNSVYSHNRPINTSDPSTNGIEELVGTAQRELDVDSLGNLTRTLVDVKAQLNNSLDNATEGLSSSNVFGNTDMYIAYIILASFCVTIAFLFITLHLILGNVYIEKNPRETTRQQDDLEKKGHLKSKVTIATFVTLQAFLITLYISIQKHLSAFFMEYVVTELNWTKTVGSNASALFWLSLGVSRLVAVLIVKKLKQEILFVGYTSLVTVAIGAFVAFCLHDIVPGVFVSLAVWGFGMAPLFTFMFTWLGSHVTPVTGVITGVIYTFISVSSMVSPIVTGYLMEFHSYHWFLYVNVIYVVSFVSLHISIVCLYRVVKV